MASSDIEDFVKFKDIKKEHEDELRPFCICRSKKAWKRLCSEAMESSNIDLDQLSSKTEKKLKKGKMFPRTIGEEAFHMLLKNKSLLVECQEKCCKKK
ncbi:uncharacterized protein MONOS_17863 [Monocercomonoides exilis]|uniref:uncharacterized protein n=1 Tax=Monocercomonoides exilis TaxID=2049356 RepID=UPI003559D4AE|nr:hypothetical protein MONOS_17863 [Monocercomonoides exilis]